MQSWLALQVQLCPAQTSKGNLGNVAQHNVRQDADAFAPLSNLAQQFRWGLT